MRCTDKYKVGDEEVHVKFGVKNTKEYYVSLMDGE
jgi:hypothetical protein